MFELEQSSCQIDTDFIIFQGVKEIEEMWNNMKFTVVPYMKGPSMRGYILGAIDEIVQNLDDSSMNLQSMSASRFVGPFLNSVQNWEKSLSHISEVLDVSTLFTRAPCKYPKISYTNI